MFSSLYNRFPLKQSSGTPDILRSKSEAINLRQRVETLKHKIAEHDKAYSRIHENNWQTASRANVPSQI